MLVAICDDDAYFCKQLNNALVAYFERRNPVTTVSFCSGSLFLQDQRRWDIVFLDIEMPDLNGIYVGNQLANTTPKTLIIIVTAYQDYLDDAFRMSAFRYLSKPLDTRRLSRTLDDALQKLQMLHSAITIETGDAVYRINTCDITYLEVVRRKVLIHTEKKDFYPAQNMVYWSEQLNSPQFFHPYKNCIVNLQQVIGFDHSFIYLKNEERIGLARRRYSDFRTAYFQYLEMDM
jgi:two-component system, LytTR family, response regulator